MSFRQGARQFFERRVGGAPTARDYVQDGLIAMWDGIENAGWGVHDPNATTWKNLAGNIGDILVGDDVWHEDFLAVSSGLAPDHASSIGSVFTTTSEWTWEGVWRTESMPTVAYSGGAIYVPYQVVNTGWKKSAASDPNRMELVGFFHSGGSGNKGSWVPWDFTVRNHAASVAKVGPGSTYNSCYLYHDGKFVKESVLATSDRTGGGLYVGRGYEIGPVVHTCNVRIYSRALTDSEIARNCAIDKVRFNLP